ncbi:2-(3-amino-3-carboxypropyl)histidine synthase subunit 2 isoform X2 [Canis lupus baileyi]|uniref:2-(3-amino-3-carboxypropyl)histidine synthase subunit 2 n=2 Tax=Canis lupus TaxID=9612 RepID=A0A8C0N7X7_CANLF|nr:2-(3-amino-3-carboxypropyl)histidine synthase subunit 2 isoform X2 [Canis lupus dingo]XP_038414257.1 2-(3-amino-3-carboxypropyl)histidine synthase subunit 2 isoform X1 [Canis lupus familiaris]XP_038543874.1 2-(3-amino-3-carboxypropyl)histidine synthase subunit 2 isoform X1 [Canis lupus familiaris]XP_532611.2 2-(3-amino-3-carboxypropyl)histidine synthase subunit 2 isoform X1 [Canis lupus familiaris]|eukprot:XP_532611.2 2-(3-amino-3-carboxypropyl)histidine synthase subunit 2 isoform X1 [Canis lupus familiaris]
MESTFSSPAEAALQREAGAPGLLTPPEDLDRVYELERVAGFVRDLGCQQVALQFPDQLLGDAGAVAARLEGTTGSKMFILGDTAYGSCCVDVLGAEQAGAQALVHFGPACLSPPARPLPVAFVLGQRPVHLELCAKAFEAENPDPKAPVVLLSEPACAHALEALATLLRPRYLDLLVSSPALPLPAGSCSPEPEPLERFGRRFPLAPGRCLEEYGAFYVGGSEASADLDPDLSRLLLGWAPGQPFFTCCPDTGQTQDEGVRAGRLRARRHYLVERARDARVVGLLAGTLGVARHREALTHLRNLTRAAGKRSYVLALGRPTPPKLANFPEVDVFVLLACPLGALAPQPPGGFFRPILAPCELEAACNPAWPPSGLAPYLTHYADLLPGSPFHVPLPPPDSELWDTPDVSLITGELRPPPAWKPSNDPGCLDLNLRPQLELAESSPAALFLSSRSWRGLEPRLGQTTVTGAVSGRRGIAIAYEDEGNS